jgi:CheY-like chemotaxis protein
MKIIVVDDEPIIRSLARRILQRAGYEVLEAENGYQCLRIFEENRPDVVMVVLDQRMDGLTGLETLERLRQMEPELPCILSSGQATGPDDIPSSLNNNISLLQKPYRADALSQMAGELMAACRG